MWVWFRVWMSDVALVLCLAGCAGQDSGLPFAFSFGGEGKPLAADQDACGTPQDCSERLKRLVKNPNREWIWRAAVGRRIRQWNALVCLSGFAEEFDLRRTQACRRGR